MKIIILTNNNSFYGKKMIQQFEAANIPIEAVIVINQPLSYHIKLFNYVRKRVGFFEAIIFALKILIEGILEKEKEVIKYENFTSKIIYTKATNSLETETTIKNLNPDLLILAQTGIIRKNILSIPKIGTLNSHPAILPYYRGIDCHKWALLNNDFSNIGSTVHWVNVGVDTGNIINTKKYKITKAETEKELEWNLYLLCIGNLKETILNFLAGNISKGNVQNKEDGKQFYKMPMKFEKRVRNILLEKYSN